MNPIIFKTGDHAKITLNMPIAMIEMSLVNLRKIMKWAKKWNWNGENEEAFTEFFSRIPEVAEELRSKWHEESIRFQREFRLPENGKSKWERDRIKYDNKRLYEAVKKAKTSYEKFQKRIPKLMEMNEMEGQ